MQLAELLADLGIPDGHTVTLEAHAGPGAYGDVYDPPAELSGVVVDQKRRLVRAPNGSQVVSSTTVYAPLGTACPDRSRITLPDGQQTLVITTAPRDGAGLDVPEHLEITCE